MLHNKLRLPAPPPSSASYVTQPFILLFLLFFLPLCKPRRCYSAPTTSCNKCLICVSFYLLTKNFSPLLARNINRREESRKRRQALFQRNEAPTPSIFFLWVPAAKTRGPSLSHQTGGRVSAAACTCVHVVALQKGTNLLAPFDKHLPVNNQVLIPRR